MYVGLAYDGANTGEVCAYAIDMRGSVLTLRTAAYGARRACGHDDIVYDARRMIMLIWGMILGAWAYLHTDMRYVARRMARVRCYGARAAAKCTCM
eukprot:2157309-Rhodomonas_salina.1